MCSCVKYNMLEVGKLVDKSIYQSLYRAPLYYFILQKNHLVKSVILAHDPCPQILHVRVRLNLCHDRQSLRIHKELSNF